VWEHVRQGSGRRDRSGVTISTSDPEGAGRRRAAVSMALRNTIFKSRSPVPPEKGGTGWTNAYHKIRNAYFSFFMGAL